MSASKKPDDLAWQQVYAAQLLRTSGKKATFERYSGSWWTLVVDGEPGRQRLQRGKAVQMTENLIKRPDYEPAAPAAA